ncbi:MAG: aspartate-semialdehyde dehydrogenase [Phenylobacterium sp.]|uniref:aspartate-semialdehyde dehydrogenase n=1 Tax=Phenylobacterium sp. TaxID=1871053 RepID=UPI001B54061F|nr:aspartate-semialdehyde dehydrogenase [Phenylobacterium sp.]MBP7816671.1 aspartate-semialdehyde dehydrogenase [Phenylobacterium sp.]MBP9232522.1 aspartate-semialdehyde dehydrogenase [Phenylobacterium sp.]MBP9756180.1 aspartate-semialdehyde dehydrogenase [Phenylobacterium sp.]
MSVQAELELPARQRLRNVAIVGATGAVGAELIGCLERRDFPVARLKLLASARSAGRTLMFKGQPLVVETLAADSFDGVDIALFSAGAAISRQFAPIAAAAGCVVVDNSSAFRMDPATPLVVPEVNGGLLDGRPMIVANPNCVAAIAVMALAPLHAHNPIVRVIGATYQSASGAGAAAMEELELSTAAYLAGEAFEPKVLPHPYAFNVFSHNTAIDPATGYNSEETKVMDEIRKLLAAPDMRVSFTCVRVPVLRAHSMALTVEFARPMLATAATCWLAQAPGVRLVNDSENNHFPMPSEASGEDDVLVGRLRADASDPTGRSLTLFLAGDQLLKGAALNAVQIAEQYAV